MMDGQREGVQHNYGRKSMGNLIDFAQREALDSRENEIRSILFHYSFFPTNKHITKGWIPYESEMSITMFTLVPNTGITQQLCHA